MSYEECQRIASQVGSVYESPPECQKFQGVVRNNSTVKAFDGMGSSAAAAISARAAGRENYAQIQRRYTNAKRFQDDH
jgi:homoserine kinase